MEAEPPAVRLEGVSYRYPDGPLALDGVDLVVPRGRLCAVLGRNGCGKTSLLRLLVGLLRPDRGRVEILGQPTAGRSVGELARQVGLAFQNPDQQIFAASVREEVAFGPRNLGLSGERVEEALRLFGLEGQGARPPALLSRGERRRVALASVWAMGTPLLALDEPTGGLDLDWLERLMEALRRRTAAGGTVILVTHDVRTAARASWMALMDAGRVVRTGSPGEVLGPPWAPPVLRLAARLGLPGRPVSVEGFLEAWGAGR